MPIIVEREAAKNVRTALPPAALQNPAVAKTRANAAPPSESASTATATTGSAKKSASSSTPGRASAACFVIPDDILLFRPRRFGPALVDLGLLRRRALHVERTHLRRHRQLVDDAVGQLHARDRGPHETLRENALAHVG